MEATGSIQWLVTRIAVLAGGSVNRATMLTLWFSGIVSGIVDLKFLDKTAVPIVVDVENEISQMGNFLLLVAKERAVEQGVKTSILSRKGNVREEIKKTAINIGSTLVVLGRPVGETSAFELSSLKAYAKEIELETGAEVKIV